MIMKVLVTNDDGIDADGIQALVAAIEGRCEITVVAPAGPMSECSHKIETRKPIRVVDRGSRRYAVDGSPADCVRIALRGLFLPDPAPFDLVVSGINQGGNLGIDRYLSGTVAAAREAAILGVPGIAISHYIRRAMPINWSQASSWVASIWDGIAGFPPSEGHYLNINFPHLPDSDSVPPLVSCKADNVPLDVKFLNNGDGSYTFNGSYPDREKTPGCDTEICFGGHITSSLLSL